MMYFGGKVKLGPLIAAYLNSIRKPQQLYIEPFVGGGNVIQHIRDFPIVGFDRRAELIEMFNSYRYGWRPPKIVTKADHDDARQGQGKCNAARRAFILTACSYNAVWRNTYTSRKNRNTALAGYNGLRATMRDLHKNALLIHGDFFKLKCRGALIYCDPPYANTAGTREYGIKFDHERFWKHAARLARFNTVVVSEYTAPNNWKCVKKWNVPLRAGNRKNQRRCEKLFQAGCA